MLVMSGYRRAPPGAVRGALREEDGDVGPDCARPLQQLRVAGRAARRLVGRPQRGRRVCAAAAQARACGARALEHSCMLSVAMEALTLIDVQSASLPANSTLQLRQGRRHGVVLRQLTRRAPCGTTLRRWTRKKRASPVRCLNRLSACTASASGSAHGRKVQTSKSHTSKFHTSKSHASKFHTSKFHTRRPSVASGWRARGPQRRRALTTRLLPSVGTPGMSQVSSSRRAPGSGVKSSVSPRSITCARARTLEPGVALSAALHSAALHSVSWPGRMRREAVKKTLTATL